jgi:hypothetical protein
MLCWSPTVAGIALDITEGRQCSDFIIPALADFSCRFWKLESKRDCVTSLEVPASNVIQKPLIVYRHVAPDINFLKLAL